MWPFFKKVIYDVIIGIGVSIFSSYFIKDSSQKICNSCPPSTASYNTTTSQPISKPVEPPLVRLVPENWKEIDEKEYDALQKKEIEDFINKLTYTEIKYSAPKIHEGVFFGKVNGLTSSLYIKSIRYTNDTILFKYEIYSVADDINFKGVGGFISNKNKIDFGIKEIPTLSQITYEVPDFYKQITLYHSKNNSTYFIID